VITAATLPTGSRGRLLALAIAGLAVAIVYLAVAAPLLDLYARRQAFLENQRMLAPRLEAAEAALPALRARITALHAAERTLKVTLDGASDAIASANLQSRIEALAASAGAAIGSTESLPAATVAGYRRIGLRLVLSGSYETIVKLLATIQSATPPLVIDNLQIHGILRRPGMPNSDALDAALDVYGFRSNAVPAAEQR
jgi:general secretion pathway protein M